MNSHTLRKYLRAINLDTVWAEEWLRLTNTEDQNDGDKASQSSQDEFRRFQRFFDYWELESAAESGEASAPFTDGRLRDVVTALPPLENQVLLLCDFVGFSVEEAAALLKIEPTAAADRLDQGRRLAEELPKMSVLILEDHGLIAQDLSDIASDLGLTVIGIAENAAAAEKLVERNWPDIVISDQMLSDGDTGLEVLAGLRAKGRFYAIYVTAYPEEVLTGLDDEPAVVVSKPFEPEAIRAAIGHTLSTDQRLANVIDAEEERQAG